MATPNWQLQTPLDAIIFDCDGTLSTIEGIDALAMENRVGEAVAALTADAMGTSGMSLALYQKRLNLVRPTHEQVFALGEQYYRRRVPEVSQVFEALQQLDKPVYIVSAGLSTAVVPFGQMLGVPATNIFAVNINFNVKGEFLDFDHQSPLVTREGKRLIVSLIKARHPALAYVGDGLNDYATYDLVTRFIGYGGVYYRENIAALCDYYIKTPSLAPLLPLILTEKEAQALAPAEQALYLQGQKAIEAKEVAVPHPK